jgi:uncharacterized protein (TIGR03435 family)
MMNRRFFAGLLAASAAFCQTPASLEFEVASVKPSGPQSVRDSGGGPGSKDPTRYHFQSATLRDLIAVAWQVSYFQISSKSPVDKDRYDLIANVPEGATRDQFRQMLKDLLVERFQLKTHLESKDFAAYELVIAKGGLKLKESGATPEAKPSAGDDRFPALPSAMGMVANFSSSNGYPVCRMRGKQQTVGAIARMLRTPGSEPIVDKTGLAGLYDFTFEYALDQPGSHAESDAPPVADLFMALQEQLGLQLVAKKLPFDVVVVESLARTPAEN